MRKFTISVDIGGTFTDIIVNEGNRIAKVIKVPTRIRDPASAVIDGLRLTGITHIDEMIHATTIATNSILGQYGLELPRTAIITTRGFADVIEIGRQNRPSIYDLGFKKPVPLVPRHLRYEVDERTDATGKILKTPRKSDLERIAKELVRRKVRTVAISFLHSYLNPGNEKIAGDFLSERFDYVSLSSEVSGEPREYERTSSAVLNAALSPLISAYLGALSAGLKEYGCDQISIMSNSGGLIRLHDAIVKPIKIIESGPAAGVIAANEFGRAIGDSRIISFDMGGTTAKASTIVDNRIGMTSEYEVGGLSNHGRIVKGTGYPVRTQFVDIAEVSAGGGTIIWTDAAGALNIGPFSAGAYPGPSCYGLGGTKPTITDANLVLGYISEDSPGRKVRLDTKKAAESLSLLGDPVKIAEKALSLADLEMARAIRLVTYERGLDPTGFALYAFGGAGPQHAARVASLLEITRVVIPVNPAAFSAVGLIQADWKYEEASAFPTELEKDYQTLISKIAGKNDAHALSLSADCRYTGQGTDLPVPVTRISVEQIRQDFESLHNAVYGFTLPRDIEITMIRVTSTEQRTKPVFPAGSNGSGGYIERKAMIAGSWTTVPVYIRGDLPEDFRINGPVMIDEYGTSTLVDRGWQAQAGSLGEIVLRRS